MRMVRRARKEATVMYKQKEEKYVERFRVAEENAEIATAIRDQRSKQSDDA
jgi:hypothetical protein